jgi:hypothetical protein
MLSNHKILSLLLVVLLLPLFIQNKSIAQVWSHEYVMPDGTSYLCGGTSDQSSCAHMDKKGRQLLYNQKQKLYDKAKLCSQVSSSVSAEHLRRVEEVRASQGPFAAMQYDHFYKTISGDSLPGWAAYQSCMKN